jgi:hypothetical protein
MISELNNGNRRTTMVVKHESMHHSRFPVIVWMLSKDTDGSVFNRLQRSLTAEGLSLPTPNPKNETEFVALQSSSSSASASSNVLNLQVNIIVAMQKERN